MVSASLLVAALIPACGLSQSLVSVDFRPEGEITQTLVTDGVDKPYTVISQLYYSQALPLLPGQMLFTDATKTPIPKPSGEFAIVGMVGDIAKDGPNGEKIAAPLSEVYDHHWIVEDYYHRNELCAYGPNYIFGIGAESRNSPLTFPSGYGYQVASDDKWGGNIHLLRTDAGTVLAGDDPHLAEKQCAECYYDPSGSKGPKCTPAANGTFQCCGDNCYDGTCSCPTKAGTPMVAINYYLRFRLNYTLDVSSITPVKVGVLTTPNCATFYEVYRNDASPESLSSTTFTVGADGDIFFSMGHMHTGGINVSAWHNGKLMCASYPTYGKREGVAGDEKGHLVGVSPCYNADDHGGKPYHITKGDKVRLDAYYWVGSNDPRIAPSPAGTHLNVMAYMFTAYTGLTKSNTKEALPPTAGCQRAVKHRCMAVLGFPDECRRCAMSYREEVEAAGCSADDVQNACFHLGPMGRPRPVNGRRPTPSDDVLV